MENLSLTTKEGEEFKLELPKEVQTVTMIFRGTLTISLSYPNPKIGKTILAFFCRMPKIRIPDFGENRMLVDVDLVKYDLVEIS